MALRGTLNHWKTKLLARSLDIPACYALGILEALWHTTSELAPAGNIGRLSNDAIALQITYEGSSEKLINALVNSGHLDRNKEHRLIVHDWNQHSDYNTRRKLERRGETLIDASRRVMTPHKSIPEPEPEPEPVPEPEINTSPNGSREKAGPVRIDSKTSGMGIEFDEIWPRFWIRTGKGAAKSAWAKARKKASRETIEAAIVLQGPGILALAKQRGSTPVHPSTWLNQERWEDDVGGLAVVESPKYSGNQQQVMAMFDERMALNLNAQQRH